MEMNAEFMDFLVAVRDDFGKPMRITSAYRCPQHNSKVSRTGSQGPHTTGMAVDVAISGLDAHTLLALAFQHGATGIGVAQSGPHDKRFIHIDTIHDNSRPSVWSYEA